MLTEFMQDCLKEQGNWADTVYKTAVAENEANQTLINAWVEKWQPKILTAYAPIIDFIYADKAADVTESINTALAKRYKKIGIAG